LTVLASYANNLAVDTCVQEGMMSLEVTDFIKSLDNVIEHDNRMIGQQQMQHAVLRWAVAHKDALPPLIRDGLIECMQSCLAQTKAERPSVKREGA
jgi:hypothetical protein